MDNVHWLAYILVHIGPSTLQKYQFYKLSNLIH